MRVLVLVPNLKVSSGGVGNIYKVINLSELNGIDYFFVNKARQLNAVALFFNMIKLYSCFFYKMILGKYDLVHVNPSLNTKSFYRDGLFIWIAKLCHVPVLTFFHGWDNNLEKLIQTNLLNSRWFRKTYVKSDQFIVLGKVFKESLIRMGVPSTTPFHLQTTVADDSFLNDLDISKKIESFEQEVNILFLSRLVKEKGIYITIDAFEALSKLPVFNRRKTSLLIAGSGPELDAAKVYAASKRMSNIKFLGYVNGVSKGETLINSHILLFPTYYGEGLPCTILEAMLYGMPVITRGVAGIPDIVQNGVNGYLTDSLDPEVFAKFLEKIISDDKTYQQMARENYHYAKNNFTSSHVRDRLLNIYNSSDFAR